MNKKAFNLAEMLLVLTIIGTISILSLQVVRKSNDDYRRMYYSAYNTLVQAAGNAALQWQPDCDCINFDNWSTYITNETCWSEACWKNFEYRNGTAGNSIALGVRRDYPGYLMGDPTIGNFDGYATDSYFCKQLTSKLNTINEAVECQYFINSYATKNQSDETIDYSKGQEFLTTFCNKHITKPSEYSVDNIEKCEFATQPSFITANGQRFYISKLLSTNANLTQFKNTNNENKINREFFRLVAVDLNGTSGPNTQLIKASGKLPDIVLFALRSNGTVVPLGLPEFNRNYTGAVVQYPEYLKEFDSTGQVKRNNITESGAMTLYDAKTKAWGIHSGSGADINTDVVYGQVFSEMAPFSYSILLYQMSKICRPEEVGGSNSGTSCPTNRYTDELLARLVTQFLFDKKDSSNSIILNPESPTADTEHGCNFRYSRCDVKLIEANK